MASGRGTGRVANWRSGPGRASDPAGHQRAPLAGPESPAGAAARAADVIAGGVPATLLELRFLVEAGRIRLRSGTVRALLDDERWAIDEPPSLEWFERAAEESWTRDPFDRLIVSHARLRRWPLATGDGPVLDQLRPSERLAL